jgi:hypothetical protein
LKTVLKYQVVGETRYFDAAGFPARQLDLPIDEPAPFGTPHQASHNCTFRKLDGAEQRSARLGFFQLSKSASGSVRALPI